MTLICSAAMLSAAAEISSLTVVDLSSDDG